MKIEFGQPYFLLILPVLAALILFIDHKYRPRGRTLRRVVTVTARMLVTCMLVLALAAPTLYMGSDEHATWLLLDGSASMRTAKHEAESMLTQSLSQLPKDLQAGVIGFGRQAMVEIPLSRSLKFTSLKTALDESDTNAATALQLAGAMLPEGVSGRIVMISDGRFFDASSEAALLSSQGISIDTLLLSPEATGDAQVTRVSVPSHVHQGQSFHVTVELYSNLATKGTLVLHANRQPVATREVEIRKGNNTFVFQDVAQTSGVVTYEAQLIADGDTVSQNDRLGAYLSVEGAVSVLLVEGHAGNSRELSRMLEAAGIVVERVSPDALTQDAEALRKYDAVVLGNVDADALPAGSVDALKRYVRVLGHGLVVVGGDSSYALGNYRGSELEELLPVTIDVKNQMDMPSVALVIAIDKSGSMTEQMFGLTRLDLAKEGAIRSVEILTERDSVGVIAFDDTAKWALPITKASDIAAIQDRIGTIRPGGGTAFFSPLYEAYEALKNFDAPLKHVIFLSDGAPADNGFQSLAAAMHASGITLSTVGVGSGANMTLMKMLADLGNGRSYLAGEFDNIPKIFTKETFMITGSYVQNRSFTPAITEQSALTDYAGFPELTGYLAVTEKPLSTVSMASDRDDPVLAWWQYGAGRVLSWTSDTEGSWTGKFLSWDEGPSFFGGLISNVLTDIQQSGTLSVDATSTGAKIRYDEPAEAPLTGVTTQAVVLLPDGTERTLELSERAPGSFEDELSSTQQGAYAVRIEQIKDGEVVRALEGGLVKPYASEYDLTKNTDGSSLTRLSELTGGQVFTSAEELLSGRGPSVRAGREIRNALLIAALLLLLLDIALRRLAWERAAYGAMERLKENQREHQKKRATKQPKTTTPTPNKEPEQKVSTADALLNRREQKKRL